MMNKITKRLTAMVLAGIMAANGSVAAWADKSGTPYENKTITATAESEVTPRAIGEPKNLGSLPYTAIIDDVYGKKYTNTLYKFETSTNKFTLSYSLCAGHPATGNRSMTVTLYRKSKNAGLFDSWDFDNSQSITFTDNDNSDHDFEKAEGTITFSGLSSDYYYYFKFYNSTTPGSGMNEEKSIYGTFYITD